jgi:hippurate hydrolase
MIALKKEWQGTLMLIGQPAEEIGQGAKMMLNHGLYQKFGVPDYGIGLHCHPNIPAGQVGIAEGFTMATADFIDLTIYGIGAHGAAPEQGIDPIVLASLIVMELQTIVSRNLKPTEAAVITVGAFNGGSKHNIIPDEVRLQLTVRTFSDETRAYVHRRIQEVAKGIAISAGLTDDKMPKFTLLDTNIPSNYNDPILVEKIKVAAAKQIGKDNVIFSEQMMIGEDFACYGRTPEDVPTVLFWLGTLPDERKNTAFIPGLHSPYYYPNIEKSLTTGVQVTTQALLDLYGKTK